MWASCMTMPQSLALYCKSDCITIEKNLNFDLCRVVFWMEITTANDEPWVVVAEDVVDGFGSF